MSRSIYIYKQHRCGSECKNLNEDGRCERYNKSDGTHVSFYTYDTSDWCSLGSQHSDKGLLLKPDKIVIHNTEITITFKSHGGFTRKELIDCIIDTYRDIHDEPDEYDVHNHSF
jgi:hypothetical protein